MKLSAEDITFQNFLTFGKIPQQIKFTPGINIVTGLDHKTERSNGSGKSSLLETIPFALFGRINKSVKKEHIINWKNKKNCIVTFNFKKGDDSYTIRRGIKPDFLEIIENGRTIPPPSDVRIFQKTLENEILQFDYYTFQSLSSINLNNYVPILRMDSVKKRQFLERVFGLEVFSILNDKANKRLKKTEDLIYKNKLNQETKEKIMNDILNQNESLNNQILKIGQSNTLLNDDIAIYNEILEDGNPEDILKDLNEKYSLLNNSIEQLTNEYESLKKEELIKIFDLLDIKEKEYDTVIKELTFKLTEVSSKIIISNEKITNLNVNFKLLDGKLQCPTCNAKIEGNHNDNIKNEISDIKNQITSFYDIQKEYNDKLAEAKQKRLKIINERKKLSINGYNTDKMKKFLEKIEHLQVQKRDLSESIKKYKDILNKFISLKNKIELLKEQVKKETETRDSIQQLIKNNDDKINELNIEYRNVSGSIKRLHDLTDYLEYIKLICKDDNIKQYAISSIIPYLTKQTNHYLSDVGSYFYAKFDSWLDETIEGPGIYNCTYGNLSGAEAKSIDLAVQFAFLDIARIQAGLFPDILILDELLDSSVDSIGLNNILGIIKKRQQDDGSKVYLITHRKEISDIDAENIYFVEKCNDGFSIVNT